MRPSDLSLLRIPSDPSLSPDGSRAVVAVTRIDLDADAYTSVLWVVPTDRSGGARQFTRGPRDTQPRWSPDGRWIAFLRATDSGKPQLHVMPADGGEARRVCEHPLGVSAPVWSPDSRRIAYVARVPEPGRYGTAPPPDADGRQRDYHSPAREAPRRITSLRYRLDDVGFTFDRRSHVFVVDPFADGTGADTSDRPAAGQPVQVTPIQVTRGDFDHADPAWSPDSAWLAFISARHPTRDRDEHTDVFIAPAGGGDARQVTPTGTERTRPAFSPDGATVYFLSPGAPDFAGRNVGLWALPADGSEAPRRLTETEPWDLDPSLLGSVNRLLPTDRGVISVALNRGGVDLVRVPVDPTGVRPRGAGTGTDGASTGEPERLITGERQVQGFDVAGGTTVAVVTTGTSAGELIAVAGDGPASRLFPAGSERTLTDFGAELARRVPLEPLREVVATAADGGEAHGWVVKPAGTGPFPVVLMVHGGPHAQYGHVLFDEAQVHGGAGYAVVMGNPRGSAGYGEARGRMAIGDLGHGPMGDLLALLDAALADPDLDGSRVGVMGGSYGGYMAAWISAHAPDRFRAGIAERGVYAWDSLYGTSDIGVQFVPEYCGTDPDKPRELSPLTYVDLMHLPLLLIHSEEDWRCPIEQVQRLFVALRDRDIDSELLLFPGEGHELSRSGLPSHRLARFHAILEWWDRYLKPPR